MAVDPVETFCRALWRNERALVTALAGRVDPNAADRWGNTPLLSAAQYGDLPLIERLVRRGGDLDQGRKHLTPITFAARRKADDIVEFLRRKGAHLSIVTSVHLGDDAQVLRELKRDRALAHLRDEAGTPILHHAVEALRPGAVALLLDHGADIADAEPGGETALHRLADLRRADDPPVTDMATLLLDRGADPNARNWDDVTPLHQAVRARNLAVATVLLARGADANARDKQRGSTPLRRAVAGTGASGTAGTRELMVTLTRLLLSHGADPDACDKRGVTVHASARMPEVIALLAEHRRTAAGLRAVPAKKSARKPAKRTVSKRRR